jgi:ABC-type cobalt transport system substrate-binding protein
MTIKNCLMILICSIFFVSAFSISVFAEDKWGGVDESVVEKYAEEHGREAVDPIINTDQGDLLLFVFLLAGAVGGFIGGYYWKELMDKAPNASGTSGHRTQT